MTDCAFVIPGDITLPTGGYAYDRRVLAQLPSLGIATRHVALPGSYPAPTPADLDTTARTLAALPADTVLLVDGLAYGAMPETLVAAIRQPIVALCHHPLALEAGLAPARAAELEALERASLAFARHVVVTSATTGDTLVAGFGVPRARITVAEPGTDAAPRAKGSGSACVHIVAVGSIVPRKAYGVLVEALAPLAHLDWRLTIAGAVRDAAASAELDRCIAAGRLEGRITLVGALSDEDLARLYDGADLFVLSSLYEGYGMVLGEAMARGLPIVTTTGGAAAQTVPDGAALKVPPGDVRALSAALATAVGTAAQRARMGDASWEAGQRLPRWTDTAGIIADVLQGVTR